MTDRQEHAGFLVEHGSGPAPAGVDASMPPGLRYSERVQWHAARNIAADPDRTQLETEMADAVLVLLGRISRMRNA